MRQREMRAYHEVESCQMRLNHNEFFYKLIQKFPNDIEAYYISDRIPALSVSSHRPRSASCSRRTGQYCHGGHAHARSGFGVRSCGAETMRILICAPRNVQYGVLVRFFLFISVLLSVSRIPSSQMMISRAMPFKVASPLSAPPVAAPQLCACSDPVPCAPLPACALVPEPLRRHVDFALALSREHLWFTPDLWW